MKRAHHRLSRAIISLYMIKASEIKTSAYFLKRRKQSVRNLLLGKFKALYSSLVIDRPSMYEYVGYLLCFRKSMKGVKQLCGSANILNASTILGT